MLARGTHGLLCALLGACRQQPAEPPVPSVARDPWLEATGRGIDFRAVGQEPGWYLEIDNERSMHLAYDYAERTATTPVPAPVVKGDEISYTAVTDAHRLAVLIEPRPCSDTMSGQRFPRTVTVTIDGQTLRGCGRSLTAPDSRWRVTARGLGPVRVGMTVAEASAALGMPLSGADAAGECIYVRPSRELAGVMFMVVNGAIARVDVTAGDVATEEGVRVGDSNESVREFYAGRVTASPHKYTDGEYPHDRAGRAASHRVRGRSATSDPIPWRTSPRSGMGRRLFLTAINRGGASPEARPSSLNR